MKPRVLVLTTYYHPVIGGVESHARQLVAYLRRAGIRRPGRHEDASAGSRRHDAIDEVPVHRVGPAGERQRRAANGS